MLRDGSMRGDEVAWTGDGERSGWEEIDRALRELARRRGALDAEEAQLLCVAVEREIWRAIGKASLLEYLEDVLGYSPRAAKERVRVALALDEMPELAEALATGELAFSAIRELTRVATPETQQAWRDAARGQNLRQIEQAVSGRKRGDLPTDPPDPDLEEQILEFKLRPAVIALFRQARQALADELGAGVHDDNALFEALCRHVLDRGQAGESSGRARYQLLTFVCEACKRGWREGAGMKAALDDADLARAECDAQRLGSDAVPERAVQDVPPMVARFVRARDGRKCCVPACRATQHVEIHHVVPHAQGGTHHHENLTLLCDGHHRALHEGKLTISGKAPTLEIRWTHRPNVGEDRATHVGEDRATHVGEDRPTHVGEDRPTHVGEDRATHVGEDRATHVGEDRATHVGADRATHVGEDRATHVGRQAIAKEPPGAKLALAKLREEAKQALVQLQFSRAEARAAIDAALMDARHALTLEQLIFESLRRCPRPLR